MEFEKYEDVIDAYEREGADKGYSSLTDYIKGENIKIQEIDMSPMTDLKDSLSSKPKKDGIMATEEAMMMAEGPMQVGADDRDPFLVEEYEKYVFEMLEQGLEPMSFEMFRSAAIAGEARKPKTIEEEIQEKKVISLAEGGIPELLEG